MNSVDSPSQLVLSFPFVFFANGVSHLRLEIFDGIFDQVPTIGRLLSFQSSSERHDIPYPRERERERERCVFVCSREQLLWRLYCGKKKHVRRTRITFFCVVYMRVLQSKKESLSLLLLFSVIIIVASTLILFIVELIDISGIVCLPSDV